MYRLIFVILALLICTSAEAANRFAVCATTCTWDGASTAMWSTTTGGATGASVPVVTDGVIIDNATCVGGTTCTITVNTNFSILSLAITGCNASTTGCILDFSVNNNNVTLQTAFSVTGTTNGNVKFGSATINVVATSGGSTAWNVSSAGTTITAGTSTLNFSGTLGGSRSFFGGARTYATVNIPANTGGGFFFFGSGNFGTVNITAPNNVTFADTTITGALTASGTSSNQIFFGAANAGTTTTISGNPATTISWAGIRDITFASSVTATNSMDLGHNSNVNFGGSGGGCILGGWLLWRDMPNNLNDNFPAWLDKAA